MNLSMTETLNFTMIKLGQLGIEKQ